MKKLKSSFLILLSVCLIFAGLPFAYPTNGEAAYVTSDNEGYYQGLVYGIDSYSLKVYCGISESIDLTYLTSYKADQIAIYDGTLYVSTGRAIHAISLKTKADTVIFNSNYTISRFAVSGEGIYLLVNGSIILLKNGTTSHVITSGIITDFWLEDIGVISYITVNEESIFTRDLVSGNESVRQNIIAFFDAGVPIKVPSSGSGTQPAGSITTLKDKFPAGMYWNHVGSSRNNPDGVTSTPCGHHKDCDYSGSCGCNSYSSAIQCMGYAFKCGYDVYGSNPRNWTVKSSTSALDSVKPGDVIRYRNDGHSIFVIGVNGNTITITDCNWNGTCNIRWNATISKSTISSTFTKLYSAPYVAPGNGGYSGPSANTVYFNANGGSVSPTSIQIYSGNAFGDLPIPTRTGYEFTGWYTQSSSGEKIEATDICNYGLTLYAHWKIKTYVVSYNANGGSGAMPTNGTFQYGGSTRIGAEKPSRDGFTFKEWNSSPDGLGQKYSAGETYKTPEDLTLYAIWNGKNFYVYYKQGSKNLGSKSVIYGNAYGELMIPEQTGYNFDGWYLDDKFTQLITPTTQIAVAGSHSIYAKFSEKTYTISYDANGGTGAPDNQIKKYSSGINLSSVKPKRTGYTFAGWIDEKGNSYSTNSYYNTNADLTLTAVWEPDKYTVTLNANGGENGPESQTKFYGTALIITDEVPTKAGFDFVEWNTKADGSGTSYPKGSKYTSNSSITLYAIWEKAKVRVAYDLDGGENGPKEQVRVQGDGGSIILSKTIPTKEGFNFINWTDGENTYEPGFEYKGEESLTLKAVWERKKYNITYYANNGTTESTIKQKEYGIDYSIAPCSFNKTGYKCTKWNTDPNGNGTSYIVGKAYTQNDSLTLYAVWEPETYYIYFITGVNSNTVREVQRTYSTAFGTLPAPFERPGYTFEGWYRNNGKKVYPTDIYNTAGDITLRANWVANTYKITLDYGIADMPSTSLDITYDHNYTDIPTPEKDGYIFAGWFTEKGGDVEIKNSTPMTTPSDHTLYAAWVKNPVFVKLDAQGGSLDSYYLYCSDTYGTLPTPVKEGYKFDGWYKGTSKVSSATLVGESSHALTAHWSKATYKLSFDVNGGISDIAEINYQYGDVITLPDATKSGCTFIGWYDDNGNEIISSKAFNRTGNITATAKYIKAKNGYITFVANGNIVAEIIAESLPAGEPAVPLVDGCSGKWESYNENTQIVKAIYAPEEFTITYIVNGISNTITAPYGTAISEPDVKAADGYVFTGWDKQFPTTMPAMDVTVKAEFTKADNTAIFISDGVFAGAVPYSDIDVKVAEPEAPQKPGYVYYWPEYTLQNGGTVIFASRKYAEYKARFVADGELVDELTYTIATESLTPKAPTEKKGYNGEWEKYSLTPGGITVNAVYTPKKIKLTFTANKRPVKTIEYTYGATAITPPEVPQIDWYSGKWGGYTLGPEDSICEAIYTPKTYTATFFADGVTVDKLSFNINTIYLVEPAVPYKNGFDGYWSNYKLEPKNITINAVYSCYSKISIFGYLPTRVESYRTTMIFRPYITNAPDEYEIHWLVNGKDMGKGNPNGAFTVTEARETYDTKAVLLINNQIVAQTETETVKIKATFIDRIRAFFRGLFGRLPVKTQ